MKNKNLKSSLLSLAFVAACTLLAAPISYSQINYQGTLTDSEGAPLADGQYVIEFSIWNEAGSPGNLSGTPLWGPYTTDNDPAKFGSGPLADVIDGRFNVSIGNPNNGGVDDNQVPLVEALAPRGTRFFLQIKVGDSDPILPRQEILSVPRALIAEAVPFVTPVAGLGLRGETVGGAFLSGYTHIDTLRLGLDPLQILTSNGDKILIQGAEGPDQFAIGIVDLELQIHGESANQDITFGHRRSDTHDGTLTAMTETMRIKGNGNVGIGTKNPGFPLNFSNSFGDKISLNGGTANAANYGFGIQSLLLQIHSGGPTGDIAFGHGHSADMTEVMRIKGNGNVGIGTKTPTKAKLEIQGSIVTLINVGGNLDRDGATDFTNTNTNSAVSIFCSNDVVAAQFWAVSDERIKTILGHTDSSSDLATLNGIEITDYRHIDTAIKGNRVQKKVIAQQVQKVFPQAVSESTDIVPDIYQLADTQESWIQLETDLKQGDRVLLSDGKKEAVVEVLEVADGKFRTEFVAEEDAVFVYGREVDDFLTVDYNAISMLNVSATQALAAQLESKDAQIDALTAKLYALEARFAAFESALQEN